MVFLEDKGKAYEVGRIQIYAWELVLDCVSHGHLCVLIVLAMVTCAFYRCGRGFGWARRENSRKPLPVNYLFPSIGGQESWGKIACFAYKRHGF